MFTESRLGATHNVSGFPQVVGDIVGPDGWDSLCYRMFHEICDPNVNTGPLRRCPFTGNNPCSSDNPDWPTIQQVNDVIAIGIYDAWPYNILTRAGFRTRIDFIISNDLEECRDDRMCICQPFGGSHCDLTNIPKFARLFVSAFKTELHSDVCHLIQYIYTAWLTMLLLIKLCTYNYVASCYRKLNHNLFHCRVMSS